MLANIGPLSEINTPAGDYWTLVVSVTSNGMYGSDTPYQICFLPTGEIDPIHTSSDTLATVNVILEPTIALMRLISGDPAFDIWKCINFLFVGYYWWLLADLGEIAPTAYNFTLSDSPQTKAYPSTNNIFINATLFQIYSEYIMNTIIPLFNKLFDANSTPGLLPLIPLNDATRLRPFETTFLRSYSCASREMKNWINLIVSVFAADYALIAGSYGLLVFILSWSQKRKDG
jgi:hypothetical protein